MEQILLCLFRRKKIFFYCQDVQEYPKMFKYASLSEVSFLYRTNASLVVFYINLQKTNSRNTSLWVYFVSYVKLKQNYFQSFSCYVT